MSEESEVTASFQLGALAGLHSSETGTDELEHDHMAHVQQTQSLKRSNQDVCKCTMDSPTAKVHAVCDLCWPAGREDCVALWVHKPIRTHRCASKGRVT